MYRVIEDFANYSVKAFSVIVAWVFANSEQYGGIINKAFDQLFSLGLLAFVLIILFKEYKSSQKYNSSRDNDFTALLKENIETRKDFQKAIERLTVVIEDMKK